MHKILLLLGLLQRGPLYGYELLRIVRAHGELYADLKKANLYYLLERLASEGYLSVQTEEGARGARGEKLIYEMTDAGRMHFKELLRETILTYEPAHTGVDTAVVFLASLPRDEGMQLLKERRRIVVARRDLVAQDLSGVAESSPLFHIASDHLLILIDAEVAWIDRSLSYLSDAGWVTMPDESLRHSIEE
jgi:DNA-binding PadR family transcriptional regulator